MRVTSNSFSDSLVTQLQTLARRQSTLQTQVASGQRVQNAAEDPLAAQQILELRDNSVAAAQYQKNIQTHQEWADATHGVTQSLQKILDRAQEIAFTVDGLDSPEDLKSYGTELAQLIEQAVQVSNTQYRGESVLGGTKSTGGAFTVTRDDQGRIQSVQFQGNTSQPASEIARGVLVSSRVPGENRTGSGEKGLLADSRSGADYFGHLIALQNQLFGGDTAGVENISRNDLKKDEENLLYHLANNGALQSRLETTMNSTKDEKLAIEGDISRRSDIDLSETIVRLTQQQTTYQATLQSAGSMLDLTLLSFLR